MDCQCLHDAVSRRHITTKAEATMLVLLLMAFAYVIPSVHAELSVTLPNTAWTVSP
jgi:hypothetical protein